MTSPHVNNNSEFGSFLGREMVRPQNQLLPLSNKPSYCLDMRNYTQRQMITDIIVATVLFVVGGVIFASDIFFLLRAAGLAILMCSPVVVTRIKYRRMISAYLIDQAGVEATLPTSEGRIASLDSGRVT